MTLSIALLATLAGLALLYFGAEFLVRGGSNIGLRLGLSPLFVGLTIVAFGTSAPELAVSVNAALAGQTDVAIGNIVGSNIANIGLILGLSALVRPLQVHIKLVRIDIPIMIATSLLLCLALADGEIGRIDSAVLFAGIIAFVVFCLRATPRDGDSAGEVIAPGAKGMPGHIGIVLVGIVMLMLGARWLVDGAVVIARYAGVSEALIGLTVVAVGTSLPEMATSILAAAKRMGDISVGNIVGSNIFNILAILGLTGLLVPLPRGNITWMDIGVMVLFAIALVPFTRVDFTLQRWKGAVLLAAYGFYIAWLAASSG